MQWCCIFRPDFLNQLHSEPSCYKDDLIFFFILQISSIMGNILQSKANVHIQLDGSLMTYFNWYGRQPDNRSNYLAMKGNQNYQWHDIWPDFKGSFLCKKLI